MSDAKESVDTALPTYDEVVAPSQEIISPTTLTVEGQGIQAASPESRLLYRLSLGISTLSKITSEVELSRVELTRDGSERQRHIYDLKHMRTTPGGWESVPAESPRYYIQRASKRIPEPAGVGIKKKRSFVPGKAEQSTAVPIDLSGKASKFGIPTFVKNAEGIFTSKGLKWVDAEGEFVAVMHDNKEDKQHSLVVTASLTRAKLDILVALWCCHVWEFSVNNAEKIHEGSAGVARKMRLAKEYGFKGFSGPMGGGGASTAF